MEEPTALIGDPLLPKPLSRRGGIESSEIEAVPKVCSFIYHGMAVDLTTIKPSKDGDVHYSQSVLPPEVTSPPLSTCFWVLIFGAYRHPETQ